MGYEGARFISTRVYVNPDYSTIIDDIGLPYRCRGGVRCSPVIEAILGYVTHRRWAKLDLRCPHSSPRRAEIGVSRKSLLPCTMPDHPRGVMPGIKSLWRCGWDETASGLFGTPTGPRGAQNGNSG